MKIEIERSGGFAGITKKITVDTEKLPKNVGNNIEEHLTKKKLINTRPNTVKSKTADCYYYKISSQTGNEKQEIEFSEFDVDNKIRRMVNNLFSKQ